MREGDDLFHQSDRWLISKFNIHGPYLEFLMGLRGLRPTSLPYTFVCYYLYHEENLAS